MIKIKSFLLFCLFICVFTNFDIVSAQTIEQNYLKCLKAEYKDKGVKIDSVLIEYESFLINKGFLAKEPKERYISFLKNTSKEKVLIATVPEKTHSVISLLNFSDFKKGDCINYNIDKQNEIYLKFLKLEESIDNGFSDFGELADIYLKIFSVEDLSSSFFRFYWLYLLAYTSDIDEGHNYIFKKLSPPIEN